MLITPAPRAVPAATGRLIAFVFLVCLALLLATGLCHPARAAAVSRDDLSREIAQALGGAAGDVGVVVHDRRNGATFTYHPDLVNSSGSIVKVLIVVAAIRQERGRGRGLSADQRALASRMIRRSDNDATTTLFRQIGGATTITSTARALGMTATAGASSWGRTTTTARDQVILMNALVDGSPAIGAGDRAYVLTLMRAVVPDQRWGVGRVPTGTIVAVKNGWVPLSPLGWRVNSIGHVRGQGRDYTIAIVSYRNATMDVGVGRVNTVSNLVYRSLQTPWSGLPPRDLTGDGRADVIGVEPATGIATLYAGAGESGLTRVGSLRGVDVRRYRQFVLGGDLDGNGLTEALALGENGRISLLPGTVRRLGTPVPVSRGWHASTYLIPTGDLTGDERVDLLARRPDGSLWRYAGAAGGRGFGAAVRIGTGFAGYVDVLAPGDLTGDGRIDVVTRSAGGRLYLHAGRGRTAAPVVTSLAAPTLLGRGLGAMSLVSGGDHTGDGRVDLISKTSTGRVYLHAGTRGGFRAPVLLSGGWSRTAQLLR